jgi:hypothetical protein
MLPIEVTLCSTLLLAIVFEALTQRVVYDFLLGAERVKTTIIILYRTLLVFYN